MGGSKGGARCAPLLWEDPAIEGGEGGRRGGRGEGEAHNNVLEGVKCGERKDGEGQECLLLLVVFRVEELCCPPQVPPAFPPALPSLIDLPPGLREHGAGEAYEAARGGGGGGGGGGGTDVGFGCSIRPVEGEREGGRKLERRVKTFLPSERPVPLSLPPSPHPSLPPSLSIYLKK